MPDQTKHLLGSLLDRDKLDVRCDSRPRPAVDRLYAALSDTLDLWLANELQQGTEYRAIVVALQMASCEATATYLAQHCRDRCIRDILLDTLQMLHVILPALTNSKLHENPPLQSKAMN